MNVPLWIIFISAWFGSWILIAILFFTWTSLTTRLLKRRYTKENDRSRSIEEFGGRERNSESGIITNERSVPFQDTNRSFGQTNRSITGSNTESSNTPNTSEEESTIQSRLLSFNERRFYGS